MCSYSVQLKVNTCMHVTLKAYTLIYRHTYTCIDTLFKTLARNLRDKIKYKVNIYYLNSHVLEAPQVLVHGQQTQYVGNI